MASFSENPAIPMVGMVTMTAECENKLLPCEGVFSLWSDLFT